MSTEPPGHQLPFLLLGALRQVIDTLHEDLADHGHEHLRPVHAVALQAVGPAGSRVTEMAEAAGVSKQAMAKTVERLDHLGYVSRHPHPTDGRALLVTRTAHGDDALHRSGVVLERLVAGYAADLGEDAVRTTLRTLQSIRGDAASFEHLVGWFSE